MKWLAFEAGFKLSSIKLQSSHLNFIFQPLGVFSCCTTRNAFYFLYLSVKWSTSGIRERERGSYSAPEFSLCFFYSLIHYFSFVSLTFVSVSPGCNGSLYTGLVLSLLREYKLKWKHNYRSLDTREVNFSYLQALNFTL